MITHLKNSKLACSAIGAALMLAVPSATFASDEGDDIIVSPSSEVQQWQDDTSRDLDRALSSGSTRYRGAPNNAIVQVTFKLGENGRADDVSIINGEGNYFAKRIAVRAVKRLRDLDGVPVEDPQAVTFLANIIFANSDTSQKRLERRLAGMERERLASTGRARTYLALAN